MVFLFEFAGICPLEARLVMVISIAPMLKMMVFSWDKTTSDHNQNGLRIQERGAMIKGIPFVHLANDLFWFNRSHLLLYLIHSILFQLTVLIINVLTSVGLPLKDLILSTFDVFQYQYGPKSCFHKNKADFGIKIPMA
ncbi:hypothetical protein HanLR1_Chr16g0600491 [Helianthus annuus]|nr:hypothetical protein HanLR1_Chr16g0600491 [Helianthus annuus]